VGRIKQGSERMRKFSMGIGSKTFFGFIALIVIGLVIAEIQDGTNEGCRPDCNFPKKI
jgi:hypothetical protein